MSKISGITTICFDIDWTLIKHSKNVEYDMLRTLGFEPDEEFKIQVNNFWNNLSKRLQSGRIVERSNIYDIAFEMIPYLSKINLSAREWYMMSKELDNIQLIDGAYEILEYLREQGYYMVASTNAFVSDQTDVLKRMKILDFFDRIYGWNTICAKPHRKALYSLMNEHSKDSIIFIGDSVYNDIYFANRTSIKSIGYNLEYNDRNEYIKPTAHITHLLEIKKYL